MAALAWGKMSGFAKKWERNIRAGEVSRGNVQGEGECPSPSNTCCLSALRLYH